MHLEKLPSGSYRVTVQHAGVKQRGTFPTRRAAQIGAAEMLRHMVAEIGARQRRRTGRHTVGDLVDRHLEQATYAASTRPEVERARKRLPDWFVGLDSGAVTARDVDRLYAELGEMLALSAVRRVHELLSVAFGRGVRWGWLRSNPVTDAEAPSQSRRVADPVDAEVMRQLIEKVSGNQRLAVAIRMLLVTGMRRGELMGLRWSDIDLEEGTVRVERSVAYTPQSGTVVKDVKTGRSGRRTVSLDPLTVEQVRTWRDTLAENSEHHVARDSYVFGVLGRPRMPDWATTAWQRLRRTVPGAQSVRLHDLRHHSASILIANGVDPVTVAYRLGHSSPTTTLRIYSHLMPGKDRAAADVVADALAGTDSKPGTKATRRVV